MGMHSRLCQHIEPRTPLQDKIEETTNRPESRPKIFFSIAPLSLRESWVTYCPRGRVSDPLKREESRGGLCSGQFLTSSRSRHVSILHQISKRHASASRISKWEFPFNSNPEQSRWLEESDKVSYMHPYLQAISPIELGRYSLGADRPHQQLSADDQIKIDSRPINSNLNVQL